MRYIVLFFFLMISCTIGDNNSGGGSGGGDFGEFFTKLIYSGAKQFSGLGAAEGKLELMDQNSGIPIDGKKAKAYRIPAILSTPGYTFVTADMRYGVPADSAHNIDSVMRRSTDNGKTWEGMRIIQQFDDFSPSNVSETQGGNFSSVAESASFIDPAIMIASNGDLLTATTTFPWNSGLMNANKGRGIQPLSSYFKQGNDIYIKLRAGIVPEENGGNIWRSQDNTDSAYEYAVKVSDFSGEKNPILKRDLTPAEEDWEGYSIDKYYNLYKNNVQVTADQYMLGRPNNTKVKTPGNKKINVHLFYSASVFHPVPTSYIFVARSTDNGNTWSKPVDVTWQFDNRPSETLSAQNKNDLSGASFLGVSPGIGYTVKEGQYKGRLLVALQKSPADKGSGCGAFSIYSDDNGNTWYSGETVDSHPSGGRRSESQYIEAPDSQLLLVHRTGNVIAYSTSLDGGATWVKITEPVDAAGNKIKNTGSDNFGVMVGASNLRRSHYFNQPMFALSLATGSGRTAGKVYLGYLKKDNATGYWDMSFDIDGQTIALPFNPNNETEAAAYSSVAELNDGGLGVFYEGAGYGGGTTGGSTISFAKFPVITE